MDASKPFVCVYLAWDDSEVQAGLRRTLRVCGAPAIVILDSGGRFLESAASTCPDELEAQLRRVARSHPHAAALRALPEARGTPWDWIRQRIADLGSDDFE